MAYTPPLGNAVFFDGTGAAYTSPLGSVVNFDTVGGNVLITLVGQAVTAQQGSLTSSLSGGDFFAALFGLQCTTFGGALAASIPGGAYSVALNGQQVLCQQTAPSPAVANTVALTTQVATTQRGPLIASTPQSVTVPLVGNFVTVQKGAVGGLITTGLIEWYYSHAQITLSGAPKLTATWAGTGHPGVWSTGAEEVVGGKRYCEIATTGWEMSFGIGNGWRSLGTQYPLGLHPSEDTFAWGIQTQSNGTLRTLHGGVATQREAYAYVPNAPLQIALDFVTGELWLGYNNTWAGGGDPALGTNPTYTGVTGFPHPVVIYGTMGGNVTFPQTDTAVLHASVNNQVLRPTGFLPWEDEAGAPIFLPLSGTQLLLRTASLGVLIVEASNISISLIGQSASIQIGAIGISKIRQRVTWNPNDKNEHIILTDNDIGATTDSSSLTANSTFLARATVGRAISSGKYYFEVMVPYAQEYQGGYSVGSGIGLSQYKGLTETAEPTTWGALVRLDWNDVRGEYQYRETWYNAAADSNNELDPITGFSNVGDWLGDDFVPGRVLQLAVDFNTGSLWFGYNGKWFNGSDPATGSFPQYSNIKTVIPTVYSALYPHTWPVYTPGQPAPPSVIGHFSLASFYFEPPAGFFPWEESDPLDKVKWVITSPLVVGRERFAVLTDAGLFIELWGLQATVQQNTALVRRTDAPFGQLLTIQQGALTATITISGTVAALIGQSVTTAKGTLVATAVDGKIGILVGQQAVAQQGVLTASYSEDRTVVLTGAMLSVQRGGLGITVGPLLAGLQLTIGYGGLSYRSDVILTGQELLVQRGMFPGFGVELPQIGKQCAVQTGTLTANVAVALIGKSLSVTSGVFTPVSNLQLVGKQLQLSQSALASNLSTPLSGLSMAVQRWPMGPKSTVPLSGQQVAVLQSVLDMRYDCNVYPAGVQAIGMVGENPTLTNVPPPSADTLLWARMEVEKLFVVIEPIG